TLHSEKAGETAGVIVAGPLPDVSILAHGEGLASTALSRRAGRDRSQRQEAEQLICDGCRQTLASAGPPQDRCKTTQTDISRKSRCGYQESRRPRRRFPPRFGNLMSVRGLSASSKSLSVGFVTRCISVL